MAAEPLTDPEPMLFKKGLELAEMLSDHGFNVHLSGIGTYPDAGIAEGDDRGERKVQTRLTVTGSSDLRAELMSATQMRFVLSLADEHGVTASLTAGGLALT